ncbi:MAG: hypothetical protein HQL76_17125 [Magnetococcales bacterium]|nr:hypothetical protein [Magnetococcales bacterium]
MNGMRLLKGIVILGGVLLLVGSILLFIRVSQHPSPRVSSQSATSGKVIAHTITLAKGNRIQNLVATQQGFALWAGGGGEGEELLFFDAGGLLRHHFVIGAPVAEPLKDSPEPQIPKN